MKPTKPMPTRLLHLVLFAFLCATISAQNIQNGNFEDWEMVGETLEPTGWETSNHSDNSEIPLSAHQTENACQGQFALKLTSTAPSLEGPGPGFARQFVDLDEPATSATITFLYAADTLLDGAFGLISLRGISASGKTPIMVASETFDINELTSGCVSATLTIDAAIPFNQLLIEMRAEPYETGFSTEGLSVIRIDNIELGVSTSVNEHDLSGQISTMPNPTRGILHLQHENLRITDIQLMDISGKLLQQIPVTSQSIDLGAWPSGTYLIRVIAEEGVAVKKVVKE